MTSDKKTTTEDNKKLHGHSCFGEPMYPLGINNMHMKSFWKSFLFSFFFLSSLLAAAQEVCDNGVDDDGDGLIDCYDGDSSADGACDDF